MKKLKLILPAIFMTVLFSCSSDDNGSGGTTADFLDRYLSQTGFDQNTDQILDSEAYEFGVPFHVTADGKMTKIAVKTPAVNPDLRVTVWNAATQTILRTEHFNVTAAGQSKTFDIDDLQLSAGTPYLITMNSTAYYKHYRTDGANAAYPVAIGDVVIEGYGYIEATAQSFPVVFDNSDYAGDLSFAFRAD